MIKINRFLPNIFYRHIYYHFGIKNQISVPLDDKELLSKQLEQNNFYLNQKKKNQTQDVNRIVESLYFQDEARLDFDNNDVNYILAQKKLDRINYVQPAPESEINLKQFKTAIQLLEFYEDNQQLFRDEGALNEHLLDQMNYCLKNEDQIIQNIQKTKKNFIANQSKETKFMEPVFLTQRQILKNSSFQTFCLNLAKLDEISIVLSCRRKIFLYFNENNTNIEKSLYEYVLKNRGAQNLMNEQYIELLTAMNVILQSIRKSEYCSQVKEEFMKIQNEINSGNNFQEEIHNQFNPIISDIYSSIDYDSLNAQQLVLLAFLCPNKQFISQFQTELKHRIVNKVSELNSTEIIQVLYSFLKQRIGDQNFYEILSWKLVGSSFESHNLSFIFNYLRYFHDMKLKLTKSRIQKTDMVFNFENGFQDLFQRSVFMLTDAKVSKESLQNLAIAANNNYTQIDSIPFILTKILRDKVILDPIYLYYLVNLGSLSSSLYEYSVICAKNYYENLMKQEIFGYIDGQVSEIQQIHKNKYGQILCQNIAQLTAAIWNVIRLYDFKETNNQQLLDYDLLNQMINILNKSLDKLTLFSGTDDVLSIQRETLILANTINMYIKYFGKSLFATNINIFQIYQQRVAKIQQYQYPAPLIIQHQIFMLEKQCFVKKYIKWIQKDSQEFDIFFDWTIRNEEQNTKILVQVCEPQCFNYNPQNPLNFETKQIIQYFDELAKRAKIQIYQIKFTDIINKREDDLLLFEQILDGLLPQNELASQQDMKKQTTKLKLLKRQFFSQINQKQDSNLPLEADDVQIKQEKDKYILSDEEDQ